MDIDVKLGQPYPQPALKVGTVITLDLPSGWLDVGIYANSTTVDGAEVEIVGGGYRKVGSARLTHLYMKGSEAAVRVLDRTGFDIVVKPVNASTAAKMASRQEKV